jgi:murein DD-endopeptidase MepM/ murein hydrolase activator NlpD
MTRGALRIAVGISACLSLLVAAAAPAQQLSPSSPPGAASGTPAAAAAGPAVRVRPEVGRIRWAPSSGRDCHVFHGRRMCEGPRRVPLLEGEALRRAETLGMTGNRVARSATQGVPPARWVEAARAAGARTAGDLLWPVPEGRLWRGYGPRRGFRRTKRGLTRTRQRHMHEGVDIGARQGSVIVAVNDGLVAYSDNRMSGYGNAVLLVHPDGAVTLYAHCVETYVVAGQLVRRGEVIAAVGQTGIAHGAHLHFEYRTRGRTADPYRLFTDIPHLPPLGTGRRAPQPWEASQGAEAEDPSWEGAPVPDATPRTDEPPAETEHADEP